jgi:glycosyltransferase involved in cell wall biosynthesis
MPPKVSIIIPAYNAEKTIKKCLALIFSQTFKDFEVIVVNDGSTDKTSKILKEFQKNFQFLPPQGISQRETISNFQIINQKNQGSNPARNRGAAESKGEYLLFCDADIEMKPQMLEKMVKTLEKNLSASFVYSSFYYGFKKFKLWPYNATRLYKMPYIHTTSLIRRRHFVGFDEKIKRLQDWDLFLTMAKNRHYGIFISEFLFKVNPRRGGISSWLPKIFYKIPWEKFSIKIKSLEEYKKAEKIIKEKYGL